MVFLPKLFHVFPTPFLIISSLVSLDIFKVPFFFLPSLPPACPKFAVMPVVEISGVRLLHEICEKLSMIVPQFEMTTNAAGQFVGCVDVQIGCEGSVAEVVRCWGGPFPVASAAEQDAACVAIKRLKEDLDLHIKDANYDDQFYYKSMYDHLSNQYATLSARYSRAKWELGMLKECHSSLAAQKEQFIAERVKIRGAVNECHALINRLGVGTNDPSSDPADSNSVTATPPI